MTSDQKRIANRRNSKKSSGPRTAGGKARSSRNAFRHGLAQDDTWQPDVAAWIDRVAHLIADPHSDYPPRLEAAREIATSQHQLKRIQQARLALLNSEPHPRLRHRLRPSGAEINLIKAALEARYLVNVQLDIEPKYRPFTAWPDAMRLAFALMIRRLSDADAARLYWLKSVVKELGKIDRYHRRAFNRYLAALARFEAINKHMAAIGAGLHGDMQAHNL